MAKPKDKRLAIVNQKGGVIRIVTPVDFGDLLLSE